MFISNSDIYTPEWIELVFENRNKGYGAYDLRKHYSRNLLKAFGIAALILTSAFAVCFVVLKPRHVDAPVEFTNTEIKTQTNVFNPVVQIYASHKHRSNTDNITRRHQQVSNQINNSRPALPNSTTTLPVVNNTIATTEAPTLPADNEIQPTGNTIDASLMKRPPMPMEGANEWATFLKNTIVYPADAHKSGIMGKVWLSFVVEKDGAISDIKVIKPAGYGFDEEAVRVLKLAPSWRPGIQNGQAVRVKFILPIDFRITP